VSFRIETGRGGTVRARSTIRYQSPTILIPGVATAAAVRVLVRSAVVRQAQVDDRRCSAHQVDRLTVFENAGGKSRGYWTVTK